jgi:hypothetical protein
MNWEYAFTCWMETRGYKSQNDSTAYDMRDRYGISRDESMGLVKQFNASAAMGFLPPLRDAMHYVRKLHEECGFRFHMITSLSLDEHACRLRRMNTEKLFGETSFEGYTFLDTGADKDNALDKYKDTGMIWIEDKLDNANLGAELGLDTILMLHGHNMAGDIHENVTVVKDWKEVYEYLTNHNGRIFET